MELANLGFPELSCMCSTITQWKKITLLAALFKSGIIGPIFLQDTVHSNLYAKILREFVAIQNDLELVANKYIVVHTKWCNPSRTPAVFILLEDEYYQ